MSSSARHRSREGWIDPGDVERVENEDLVDARLAQAEAERDRLTQELVHTRARLDDVLSWLDADAAVEPEAPVVAASAATSPAGEDDETADWPARVAVVTAIVVGSWFVVGVLAYLLWRIVQ